VELTAFRIRMFKPVLDSGWIKVEHRTVLMGKNESGKTSLLKALHKLNPFKPEPYSMAREWPRGHRESRSADQIACTARFKLTAAEREDIREIAGKEVPFEEIEVSRNYQGQLLAHFPENFFSGGLRPNRVDKACSALPAIPSPVGDAFRAEAEQLQLELKRLGYEGRFQELASLQPKHSEALQRVKSGNPNQQPIFNNEQSYISAYTQKTAEVVGQLRSLPKDHAEAHDYITRNLPTFIYMDDYRVFTGTALLDQVKQRIDQKRPTDEDKSLNTILELSGLDLGEEVKKGQMSSADDKEQRQYDLDDASATLTRLIEGRWKQRKYEVQFRADGQQFFTFVKDEKDASLIRLEERSKGFQWFFSFDLLFMYESHGEFNNCVLLLDEPGLHLHPDAQRDLLKRLEAYAEGNVLIYTTHLPFMIDLRQPSRIRAVCETAAGTVVTEDLNSTQPEARFSLQAALGMSVSSSYLVAQTNVVVEGVDDYWAISELSNLLNRSGEDGLPDDVLVTAARGASEVAYMATFMIGQELGVVALLDSDKAGEDAHDHLVKAWLTRYKGTKATVLGLGPAVGVPNREFALEDLIPGRILSETCRGSIRERTAGCGNC
jgi:predicted ATPase